MAEDKHGSVTIRRANPSPAGGERDPWAGVFNRRKDIDMAKQPEIEMEALKTHMGSTGGQIRKGAPYTLLNEGQAADHVRLGLGKRVSPEAPSEEEAAEASAAQDTEKPWAMQVTPAQYLERWPKGEHAEHAKAVLARGEGGQ